MEAMFREARAETRELLRKKERRGPWQPIAVIVAVGPPTALFAWVYLCCFGGLRFYRPAVTVVLGLLWPLAIVLGVTSKARASLRAAAPARATVVLATALWGAYILAVSGGEVNYRWHMLSFYRFQDLASYTNVDPAHDKGQSYMDAGEVYFREGSQVDTDQMISFRSEAVYCAAPILNEPLVNQDGGDQVEQDGVFKVSKSESVDFWAVGIDCCDQETKAFTCGAVPNPGARAGIRLLRDDIRPFYALAVQQWSARNCPLDDNTAEGRAEAAPLICPQARHPLFFHWVQDPLDEVDNMYTKGMHMYRENILSFFIGNALLILLLHFVLFELGLK